MKGHSIPGIKGFKGTALEDGRAASSAFQMKGDLNKDGKMSGYETARQTAIERNMKKDVPTKMKDDKKEGFAFTLTKMPKDGEKKSYSISFTFGESKFLKQFLLTSLSIYSSAVIKENNEAIAKSLAAKNN